MENKLFKVPIELFELDKITINKQKVCKISCRIVDATGDVTDTFKMPNIEPNYQCTEALELKIAELKPYLCKIHAIKEDHIDKINVTGVEVSGIEDSATFKIHGVNISDSEQRMNFSTCKVHYTGEYFGFEVDVANIIDDLKVLAHGYIFEDKRAQTTMGLSGAADVDDAEVVAETEEVVEEQE